MGASIRTVDFGEQKGFKVWEPGQHDCSAKWERHFHVQPVGPSKMKTGPNKRKSGGSTGGLTEG